MSESIFDLEGMNEALESLVDSATADVQEVEEDDAGEVLEANDGVLEDDAPEEAPQAPTALDEAIQRAMAEAQQSAQALHASRVRQELQAKRPQLLAFESLPEDAQQAVLDEATRAGIDPQTVLYSVYQQQLADFNRESQALQGGFEREQRAAYDAVAKFVKGNEYVAKLPDAEREAFIAGIGNLDAVQAIEDLALINPMKWAKAVTAIAGKEIAALAARDAGKARDASTQRAMKASVGTTRPAASKVQTTPTDPLSSLLAGPTPSWEKRLKTSKP